MAEFSLWIVRPDRLGDVLLSLPVGRLLAAARRHGFAPSQLKITWVVTAAVAPVLEGMGREEGVDRVIHFSHAAELRGALKASPPHAALFLQDRSEVTRLFAWAGVPLRFGNYSKLSSRLWLQGGVRQRRSQVRKSEYEYNIDLLFGAVKEWWGQDLRAVEPDLRRLEGERCGEAPQEAIWATRLCISDAEREQAKVWMRSASADAPLAVLHPGMGASARNHSATFYAQLLRRWPRELGPAVVSCGPQDQAWVQEILSGLSAEERLERVRLWSGRSLRETAAMLSVSRGMVAPSTGPLHLAAAVGAPVIGLYPPIQVQSIARWRTYASHPEDEHWISPAVTCPAVFHCLGEKCSVWDCMSSGRVLEDVLAHLRRWTEQP